MPVHISHAFARIQHAGQRLRKDENGATAMEFGLICVPFLSLLFGIMAVCFFFFKTYTVENAVWVATRDMRTGAMQTGSGSYAALDIWDTSVTPQVIDPVKLKREFKKLVCGKAMLNTAECIADMRVLVQAKNDADVTAGLTAPQCVTGTGTATVLKSEATAEAEFNAGGASTVVLVTACYQWKFASSLPFLRLSNMANGARLIQGSAAFRTEPYN